MKRSRDSRYIDPFTDFAFKRLFGSDPNKELLIDLLNALFEGRKVITDIRYMNTESPGRDKEVRTVIFDLLCTGDQGELFLGRVNTIVYICGCN